MGELVLDMDIDCNICWEVVVPGFGFNNQHSIWVKKAKKIAWN